MNNTDDPSKRELQDTCAYTVMIHTRCNDGTDIIAVEGVYMDFRDALANLKSTRLIMVDGWIAPVDPETRDNYPYRNRIGLVWSNDQLLGWGYAWFDPSDLPVNRVWIQDTKTWRRSLEDQHATALSIDSDMEAQLVEATSAIGYVVYGYDLPKNAKFDSDIEDLVFDEEEDDGREPEDDFDEEDRENDREEIFDGVPEYDREHDALEDYDREYNDREDDDYEDYDHGRL